MNSAIRIRFAKGIVASLFSHLVQFVVVFGTVPLLLGTWGARTYAEWLVISAIPDYLAISNLGIASAAGVEMTLRVARNDYAGARAVFSTVWTTTLLVVGAFALLGLAALNALPVRSAMHIESIRQSQFFTICSLLAIQVVIGQHWHLWYAGYRSEALYGRATFVYALGRLATWLCTSMTVLLGGEPQHFALVGLIANCVTLTLIGLDLRSRVPWLALKPSRVDAKLVSSLVGPGIGAVLMPVSESINLQGMIAMVSAMFGPIAAASFSTIRTLTRVINQLTNAVNGNAAPELSLLLGRGQKQRARRGVAYAVILCVGVALVIGGLMALGGQSLHRWWTHGRVPFDAGVMWGLLGAMTVNAVWTGAISVLVATNRLLGVGVVYLGCSIGAVAGTVLLGNRMGIGGAAVSVAVFEVVMCVAVLNSVSRTFARSGSPESGIVEVT